MPWTFAHPAAVLPLRSLCPRWLSLPALILGSTLPDLGYYLGLHELSTFSHTPLGVVVACVPIGLLLLALLRRFGVLLTVLLPAPHRQIFRSQLQPLPRSVWIGAAVAALSLLLGAASHVLWDSFTHDGRLGSALLPALKLPVFVAEGREFHVVNVLQHLSTVAGLAAMAVVYRRAIRERQAPSSARQDAWRIRLLLAGLAASGAIGALLAQALTPAEQPGYTLALVMRLAICGATCFMLFLVAASLAWRQRFGDA